MAATGTGYLIANDILTDISYVMVEPIVNTSPTVGFAAGFNVVVTPGSMVGIYVGAQLIIGYGLPSQEVVAVSQAASTTFTASFVNAHAATDTITGATFPTCQTNNEFFQQAEVLTYLAEAQNDYLLRVKCVLNRVTQNWTFTMKTMTEPADTIQIQRVSVISNGPVAPITPIWTALREQPQSSLDLIQPNWAQQGFNQPKNWYEDRTGQMIYAVYPTPGNNFSTYLLYAQRDTSPLGLADGLLLPDPFTTYVKYGCLAKMFAKDGQQADPARSKYFTQRFEMGIQIGAKFMAMAASPVNEDQSNGQ